MAFKLLDVDRFLANAKAKVVTDTFTFNRNMEPNERGLQSPSIFGVSSQERFKLWGIIELKDVVMHPLIYDNLSSIDPAFKRAKDKTKKYQIVNGTLKESSDGGTGLAWLIANWDKINFDKYRNEKNKLFIDLIKNTKNLLFINKVPVIPINYREAHMGAFKMEEDEVDKIYKSILAMTKTNRSEFTSAFMDAVKTKTSKEFLQDAVNKLYHHFLSKLESKRGFLRNTLTAKRLDNVARLVANARPDIPINSCVLPWQVLLNLFDIYVLAYLKIDEENGGDLKKKLNIGEKSTEEYGELFDFIYRNVDIYTREYPGKKEIWIEILVNIFNENPLLRVMIKRDPGWNADSLWCFQPLINSENMYNIWVPAWVYSPLGGDSFSTNFVPDFLKDNKIYEDDNYIIRGEEGKRARIVRTMDSIYRLAGEKASKEQGDIRSTNVS